jgi:hypothetical protein
LCSYPDVETRASESWIGLRIRICDGTDVLEKIWEVHLSFFPATFVKLINRVHARVEFGFAFSDQTSIPVQGLFGETLPTASQAIDNGGHKFTTSAAAKLAGSVLP